MWVFSRSSLFSLLVRFDVVQAGMQVHTISNDSMGSRDVVPNGDAVVMERDEESHASFHLSFLPDLILRLQSRQTQTWLRTS